MIDLHSHILPGVDDGAPSLEVSLAMARMAVADGTTVLACTPHIYPGMYMNDSAGIAAARDALQVELDRQGIALRLVVGADAHLVPELLAGLESGRVPTLHGSRYFLLEPSHHVAPPGFEDRVLEIMAAGYVPVLTHPERLTWVETHYDIFVRLAQQGVWMQLTAGAIVGKFGKRARHWSQRFLRDGLVHIVASDAHTTTRRSPVMSDAIPVMRRVVGRDEVQQILVHRPQAILDDRDPSGVAPPPGLGNLTNAVVAEPGKPGGILHWLRRGEG